MKFGEKRRNFGTKVGHIYIGKVACRFFVGVKMLPVQLKYQYLTFANFKFIPVDSIGSKFELN
jgi:hypothetical protein